MSTPTSSVPQKKPTPEAVARLKAKIDSRGLWTGGTNSDGYPKVKINGESELASHVLLKSRGVSLRPGQVVMHKNNNPKDLRAGNLAVGSQADNLKQMRDEGRDRPRGVPQEPDMRKRAWDRAFWEKLADFGGGFIPSHELIDPEQARLTIARAPAVTRYQLKGLMARTPGLSPSAAYQILNMNASSEGIPITHAIHNQARAAGIPYPSYGRLKGAREPLAELGDDMLEEIKQLPKPTPPKPAPPANLPSTTPVPGLQVGGVPRPRPGFTNPIQPSPAAAGLSSRQPALPTPPPRPAPIVNPTPPTASPLARMSAPRPTPPRGLKLAPLASIVSRV